MAEINGLRTALEEGMKKGYSPEDLISSIEDLIKNLPLKNEPKAPEVESVKTEISDDELFSIITDIVQELGVPANVRGYYYLREAILFYSKNRAESVTKVLYPYVAQKHSTTSSRVERGIRHAIELCWERGDADTLKKYFKSVSTKRKPTNSEVIATIADKLNLKYKLR